jgi:hypothetical protein
MAGVTVTGQMHGSMTSGVALHTAEATTGSGEASESVT